MLPTQVKICLNDFATLMPMFTERTLCLVKRPYVRPCTPEFIP